MATKTFYFLDSSAIASGGEDLMLMQEDGTAPATATMTTTGWVCGTNTAPNYCDMDRAAIVARTASDATYGWKTTAPTSPVNSTRGNAGVATTPLSGTFAAANWTYSWVPRLSSANTAQRGSLRFRMFRGTAANGSNATEITAAAAEAGPMTVAASASSTAAYTVTVNPGAFTLTNEYLFFVVCYRVTTAGGATTSNILLTQGTDFKVTTANFTPVTVVAPTGFADTEAFGTESAQISTTPTGFAETEAFGTQAVQLNASSTGFADTEAFGTLTAEAGPTNVQPTGFADTEAFGTPVAQVVVAPTGFADTEAFGTSSARIGASPTGFVDTEAFGTPVSQLSASPTGFSDTEAFGTAVFRLNVLQTGFADTEAFGTLVAVDNSATNVFPTGFADSEVFGSLGVSITASPTGFTDSETFGVPVLLVGVSPIGFADTEAFGVLLVGGASGDAPIGPLRVIVLVDPARVNSLVANLKVLARAEDSRAVPQTANSKSLVLVGDSKVEVV